VGRGSNTIAGVGDLIAAAGEAQATEVAPIVRKEADRIGDHSRGCVSGLVHSGGIPGRVGRVGVVIAQDVHRILRRHREPARVSQRSTATSGTLPSEPSTSLKTWRAPLTQFLRAEVQLLIRALAAVP